MTWRTSLRQLRHLGDAAGVVGDRAERVERDDHARHRQHARGGDRDAVELAELYAAQIAMHTAITGNAVAFIDTPRPAMMFVAWPVVRRGGDLLHGAEVRARVVLGDHDHGGREREADQRGEIQVQRVRAPMSVVVTG